MIMNLFEGKFSQDKMEFDVSALPAGIYLLKVTGEYQITVNKLIKR